MDSIKTSKISTSSGGQAKTKYKRRSGRLQCLQSIECDSKDSSVKFSIGASENDPTSKQGTSICDLSITPDQTSTIFDHEIAYEFNNIEQTSTKQSEEEKCVKKYTNSKFYTNNETEDVSKVFKLLSKPNLQSNIKSSLKSPLKTYANPRKSLDRNEVIESFGLPDTPIVPKKPLVDSILDVEVLDAKEITFQELQFVEEPWCIIDLEESFNHIHEIRIKPDPQDHLKVCYSHSTFTENFSPINNATNSLDKHSKINKKSPRKKLIKPEIVIENNSLALEGHEVEICKVNNLNNTSKCNLTTVKTNKSPGGKQDKCGIRNKRKDINSNERKLNKSAKNRCSITEVQINEVSKERRKLRSSSVTDHARGNMNSDNKVNDNEVDNSGSMRKLRSSVIHNTDIKTPKKNNLKSDKKVINLSEKHKPRISFNKSTDSIETLDSNTFTTIEVKKLRSSSITSAKTPEDETLKVNNKCTAPTTHHKSNEFTLDSESPTKKSNPVLKKELKREKSVLSNEKTKQRFRSPRKAAQPDIEASRRVSNKPEIHFPKNTKTESIKNNHKTQLDTESTINNTARTLRAYRSEIVLKPKILENSKSSKIPKSQNHKVMVSKRVRSKINYSYLTKSKSDPFLNNKESGNDHSKQLKVILHPLKKSLSSKKNNRKDLVNNMRSNRRFSKLHTPTHAENTEKRTRSCEMLLELVDIIPISEKTRDSSKLLKTKPFLNLFKNTELPLPKTLLVEDETKKTRKPETKNATKNNATVSKEDKSSKSTNNDASSICQISKSNLELNTDSTICSEIVPTSGSESPCNMKILPEKTNIDESPDKLDIKMTNRVKKSPETKADITELKNLIKKISEVEGRKCKVFTNEKLSECLRTRSYNRKSSSGDICLADLRQTSEFQQETMEDDSLTNETESKNPSPVDKLRSRTRKIIEILSEDITKPVTNDVKSKKIDGYVQSEKTLEINEDLIVNDSEGESISYQIITEKDIHEKFGDDYKKKNDEIQENILDLEGSMEAANILNDNESILRKKIDTEVEAEQVLENLETHSCEPQSTPTRLLRKREEKSVDRPTRSRKSVLTLEMVSPSENTTHEPIKRGRGRPKINKTVIMPNAIPKTSSPESESTPIRQLRKREEKSVNRPKRLEKLEKMLDEDVKSVKKTPTVGKKPNEEHQEINGLNTDFNIPSKNVFKVNSKDVSDTISTNNISRDENLSETEPSLIVENIEDSSAQVSSMMTEFDNTNDNLVLAASTPMKSDLEQNVNKKSNIESVRINKVYVAENMESNKDTITKNKELKEKDLTESTDDINKNDFIETTDFHEGITDVCDGKNKTTILVNAIPITSPETESTSLRQLRKREEKSVGKSKMVSKLGTVLPNENITCIKKTPTVNNASNETIKRCKGRQKKLVNQVNKKPNEEHQEINSLNTDFNIPNENVFKVNSKDVSDTISTNNIPRDENLSETELKSIVKDIEDSSAQASDMITEFDKTNDNLVLVASTPIESDFEKNFNAKVNIESTKINKNDMADNLESTKDNITKCRELNKRDITESTDDIKNLKAGTDGIKDYIPETIRVNKNDIIESINFDKGINVDTNDLAGKFEDNKSDIMEDTDHEKDCITKNILSGENDITEITDLGDGKIETAITVDAIPITTPETESTPIRQLRKREEKSVGRSKRVTETVHTNENITCIQKTPTVSKATNETIKRCKGRPKKQVNQVSKKPNEEHQEINSLNTDFNIHNENVFKVNSKDISDTISTNNLSKAEDILATERNSIVKDNEDSSAQVSDMITEFDSTNNKLLLVASTPMKSDFEQNENTKLNIESAKINENDMTDNLESTNGTKGHITESIELNKRDISESTDNIKNSKAGTDGIEENIPETIQVNKNDIIDSTDFDKGINVDTNDLAGKFEVNKSDIEDTDLEKDCITKNTLGGKYNITEITDGVVDSNNKSATMENAIPITTSSETESTPIRQLRKREEKSVGRSKRVIETVHTNENTTCTQKTPTVSKATNEAIKRCKGRPKKQVNQVSKKPNKEHQEINSLNTDFKIPNDNLNSKDVSDTISTNNIPRDENLSEIELNLIVEDIEDRSAQVSDMITEFDSTNDKLLLVASTPMKSDFEQNENTKVNIESAKINKNDMADNLESTNDTKGHITESIELNKRDISESTVDIKNSKAGTERIEDCIPETIQVNKNDIIEITKAEITDGNKSLITEDTDRTEIRKDITESSVDCKDKLIESINENNLNKSLEVARDEKCIGDGAANDKYNKNNVRNIKITNLELVQNMNEENILQNNDSKVIEESPSPVVVNQLLNKEERNNEKNPNGASLPLTTVECENSDDQNFKNCDSERNNQHYLLDEEVSIINEFKDVENIQEIQNGIDLPVSVTSRLRSKTSLGRRSSINTEVTPTTPRSKTSMGKKSKNSAELSPKSPTKQRRSSEKEYQNKTSPRTRSNNKTVSRLLEYDDYFEETNNSSLKERINSLEDLLDDNSIEENVSTRTRSKTSLGERIDGNTDEDFDTQKMIRSKSSLGNRASDIERNSISPKVTRSKASLENKANDHNQQENQLSGIDTDSTIQNSDTSDNMQSEVSLKESPRASRSKNLVPAAEYLNETSCETDPSKILHRRSLMPVSREVNKVVKRSHSTGSVLDMNQFKNVTNLKPKVGDIVWAQIGRYPYWPSLVSKDPVSRTFKNIVKNKLMYHVKFFGDKGRRAWINGKKLMGYKSRDDLKMCHKNLKNYKNTGDLQVYVVKPHVSKRWTKAVEEVEFVTSQNLTYKQILWYMDTGCIGDESFNKDSEEGECSTVSKKAIKRKLSLSSEDLVDNGQEKKIKLEYEESTPTSKEKPSRKEIQENLPTSSPKTEDSSTSNDNEATVDFIIIKDEYSEEEYEINFNTLKNFGSYTLDEQRSLFKRNNLFKGVPKEKVCQYCFDFGELLKCKGGCNGIYHPYCATQVLIEKHPKRKKVRRAIKLEKEESIKIEKAEAASTSGNQLDVDNHVQIVTIHSSIYDTPPRKTFPPDFENMTLGERIDFKMNEIMKKFESTTYIHSESSSEEKPNIPLVCSSFSAKCQDLFSAGVRRSSEQNLELDKELDSLLQDNMIPLPSATKPIKHVTADSPGGQNDGILNSSSESIGKIETVQPIKHVTADCEYSNYMSIKNNVSAKKESKNQSKQRISLMKHVTADSPSSGQHSTENKEPIETKTFNGHKKLKQEADNVDSESLRSSSSRQSKQSDMSEHPEAYRNINPKNFKCGFCVQDVDPYCFICNEMVSKRGSCIRQKCSLYQCSRFYHPECLKLWPQTQWSVIQTTKNRYSKEEIDSFVCPQHVCHTCASDDPRAATSRCSGDKIVKCLCCPSSYHSTNLCVPAGAEIITSTQIICPRHRSKRTKPYTINTTWCLLCNQGGNLICCETCPTSVHPECMTVSLTDDDRFICEDCECGRLPLYDEVVWVKLGYYKWWPALIIFPNEVPQNVYNAKHSSGEFVVKFFGTYNYYWMNRGRAFLFQEGDTVDTALSTKKKVEAAFLKAVKEAVVAHKMKKRFKLTQSAESANSMKPPPYIKIKVSKPVGNVRFMELDLSNTTACDCNPNQINPCGPDSNCLNRLLLTECNPEVCPAGKLCKNQSFEQREYPLLTPYKTETRGWGLKTLEPVKKGQFVIEYVGELIDDEEYQRRILKMHAQKEENYYFLTIHKDRMIDAGPKGNMARFMNHCCQPNCETQKWTVNGDTRVGLFANTDIPAHTELTFNYNLECTGTEKKVCKCGAPNCSGFIGVKVKNEINENRKPKKERKKKEPEKPLVLPPCYQCQKKGNVSLCSNKICNKAYHLKCLKLNEMPEGKKFVCPWHYCNICSKRTIRCCVKCLNSFCPPHSEGNVRYDNLLGFVCSTHDPTNIKSQTSNVTLRKKKNHLTTDEAVVTSTTDDNDDDVDDVSLLERQRQLKKSTNNVVEDENVDFAVIDSSTFNNPAKEAGNESQNETVSSATASDFEDEFRPKRKRKPKKRLQDKRLRLKSKNVVAHNKVTTANSLNESEVSEVAR